jgi:hypothetical protein
MSPALRPVRAIMEKLDQKPEPQPLSEPGKRVEPSWWLARNDAGSQKETAVDITAASARGAPNA